MKKLVYLLSCLFLLSAGFAACSSESEDPPEQPSSHQNEEPVDSASVDKDTITIVKDTTEVDSTENHSVPYKCEVVIDGIKYFINTEEKTAEVRANSYTNEVVIPETVIFNGVTCYVTSMVGNAFRNCSGLTSITIPKSMTYIDNDAFLGCSGLTAVHISDLESWCKTLFSMGTSNPLCYASHLFLNGQKVTELVIPDGLTYISSYAFINLSDLTSVSIPNSVTGIGMGTFHGCINLSSIKIPNSLRIIGDWGFMNCTSLTTFDIPDSVYYIGRSAFAYCSNLTSITLSNKLSSIESGLFDNCKALTAIEIPHSVTSIGTYAFYGCEGLTSTNIPDGVTSIGINAFCGCKNLTSVSIPNSVTSIGIWAFYICPNLTSVVSQIRNPFEIEGPCFDPNVYDNGTLYVPVGTIDKYKAMDPWQKFVNIKENT